MSDRPPIKEGKRVLLKKDHNKKGRVIKAYQIEVQGKIKGGKQAKTTKQWHFDVKWDGVSAAQPMGWTFA